MKLLGNKSISKWMEYFLCFLMGIAVILTLTLYWTIPFFTDYHPGQSDGKYEKYFVVLFASGVLSLLILWQARGIMRIINHGNPFIPDMVRRLRLISLECLILAAVYFFSIFFVTRFFMIVVFATFSVVGLILLVFAELFRQAIEYKEENDMTI